MAFLSSFSLCIVEQSCCKSSDFIMLRDLRSLELCKGFLFIWNKSIWFADHARRSNPNHLYLLQWNSKTSLDFLFLILWILICVFGLWVNWEAFSFCALSTFLQGRRHPLLIGSVTITTSACRYYKHSIRFSRHTSGYLREPLLGRKGVKVNFCHPNHVRLPQGILQSCTFPSAHFYSSSYWIILGVLLSRRRWSFNEKWFQHSTSEELPFCRTAPCPPGHSFL